MEPVCSRCKLYSVVMLLAASLAPAQQAPEAPEALTLSARYFKFHRIAFPDSPQGGVEFTRPRSINDDGVVVGEFQLVENPNVRAFVYQNGQFSVLSGPLSKGNFTYALAVNNKGQILIAQGQPHSGEPFTYFLYDMGQRTFRPISPFIQVAGAPSKIRLQDIDGLNDQGQFVGNFTFGGKHVGGYGSLVLGEPGSLPIPSDAANFTMFACPERGAMKATGINDNAQVTGSCEPSPNGTARSGFFFSHGEVTVFDYPGADKTRGDAINNAGVVVGQYELKSSHKAGARATGFAYDGSQFAPIALFSHRDLACDATGINNKGQIAGIGGENFSGFVAFWTASNPLHLGGEEH